MEDIRRVCVILFARLKPCRKHGCVLPAFGQKLNRIIAQHFSEIKDIVQIQLYAFPAAVADSPCPFQSSDTFSSPLIEIARNGPAILPAEFAVPGNGITEFEKQSNPQSQSSSG